MNDADEPHRKNGCTPLHLAHFCTIVDTNPDKTIRELTDAGADINNPGSRKCGKFPIEHAIQHQRLNSVRVLLSLGSQVHTTTTICNSCNNCVATLLWEIHKSKITAELLLIPSQLLGFT